MADIDAVLEQRIKAFVDELHALVKEAALASVKEALGVEAGRAPGTRPKKGRGARKAAPAAEKAPKEKGGRRSPEELERTVKKLEQHVQANPGESIEKIAKALGVPSKTLALPAKKLIRSGVIRTEGIKRNTKYFPGGEQAPRAAKRRSAKK